ncbi:hypothetical protein Aperf_G00000007227 [Anoplocephala perfoliata]
MDADLLNLRKILADIVEVISLTPQDQVKDLIDLKTNIEGIISLREAGDRKQSEDPVDLQADIFAHLPDDDVPGSRCSILGWTSRGYFVHQNAVVTEVLRTGENSRRMRLYMVNPTKISEVPCYPFLLHKSCPKGSLCRFSHGTVIPAEDLHEWNEPSADLYLNENQLCLALPESTGIPLWRHGYIRHTDVESGTCVVEWITVPNSNHMDSAVSLPFTHIYPISVTYSNNPDLEQFDSSGLLETFDEDDELGIDISNADNYQQEQREIHFSLSEVLRPDNAELFARPSESPTPTQESDHLGAWETHTRGIGSRLLRKMGYYGQGGLGKEGTGRRLPVSTDSRLHQIALDEIGGGIRHRPTIDQLIKLKAGIKKKTPQNCRRSRDVNGSLTESDGTAYYTGSVFEFLNSRVLGDSRTVVKSSPKAPTKRKMTIRELNVEIYEIQREIQSVKRNISRTESILSRNDQRDRRVAEAARQKLVEQRQRLNRLHEQESKFTSQVERRKSDAKLRIF